MKKTNAIRIIESNHLPYELITYDSSMEVDGLAIARASNLPVDQVFKTLVSSGKSKNYYVFVIPVNKELDLKKGAEAVGEKSISLIHQKDLLSLTGYIRGGVSPIGMKKKFTTIIDSSGQKFENIYVSGGQKGIQVMLSPVDLCNLVEGSFKDIVNGGLE